MASMATNSTRRILNATRELHEMALKERPDDDFLSGMTKELVKSTERLLAREITPPLVIRREEINGR